MITWSRKPLARSVWFAQNRLPTFNFHLFQMLAPGAYRSTPSPIRFYEELCRSLLIWMAFRVFGGRVMVCCWVSRLCRSPLAESVDKKCLGVLENWLPLNICSAGCFQSNWKEECCILAGFWLVRKVSARLLGFVDLRSLRRSHSAATSRVEENINNSCRGTLGIGRWIFTLPATRSETNGNTKMRHSKSPASSRRPGAWRLLLEGILRRLHPVESNRKKTAYWLWFHWFGELSLDFLAILI